VYIPKEAVELVPIRKLLGGEPLRGALSRAYNGGVYE